MKVRYGYFVLCILLMGCEREPAARDGETTGTAAETAAPHPGEAPYLEHCAGCHDQAVYKVPSRTFIAMIGPRNVLAAMNGGLMAEQAADLDERTRVDIAEFLTGQSFAELAETRSPPACDEAHDFDPGQAPLSLGWGVDHGNSRFQPAETGGLSVEDVPGLELKWSFAYPNGIKARSQPVFGGGAIYFGGPDGTVRALDAETGCLRWTFKASAEVRTALVISPRQVTQTRTRFCTSATYLRAPMPYVPAPANCSGKSRWMTIRMPP